MSNNKHERIFENMLVLVINAGSSSLKYQLIDMDGEKVLAKGNCDRIGIGGHISHKTADGRTLEEDCNFPTHTEAFEKLVENAVKSGYKDTVIVTHGGVIMTILAAYGVPRAKFYDWVVNNGCGYSIRIMPSLWMCQKVCEVYSKVPNDLTRENDEESMYILDLVREASNTAYGYNK